MSHYIPPTHEHDLDPIEGRTALVQGDPSFSEITEVVARPIEMPHKRWILFFLPALALLSLLPVSLGWLFWEGVGVWGNNVPIGWGWPIINFVFWVGIGHAGTLISAVLFLFRQKWRTSINRGAEAMTIFAVICALIFPGVHVGRVWAAYWLAPVPNQMQMWVNFRSPLLWDVFAVSTYFTVSSLFWYVGLIPDLATMRDRSKTKIRRLAYGFFSLGWRGSARHWVNYEAAYLLLAAMATPLVLSVHSIVSFDFAVSNLPGWHTTIFPPYFVAGAIFSGFGMVLTLMIPLRVWFNLEHIITLKHLENMAKIILLTGSIVGYAYSMEFFIAWYSGNEYEAFVFQNRAFGPYAWGYWTMMSCNVITPQFIWFKKIRQSPKALFVLSIFVNIGMWFERFVIVVTSLHHDFLPSSWDYFSPTIWDVTLFLGSFGLFFTLFLLFLRYLPLIAIAEVKSVMPRANPHWVDPDKAAAKKERDSHGASGDFDSKHDDDEPEDDGTSDVDSKVVVKSDEAKDEAPEVKAPDDEDTKKELEPAGDHAEAEAPEAAADDAEGEDAKAEDAAEVAKAAPEAKDESEDEKDDDGEDLLFSPPPVDASKKEGKDNE